jgi:hypothetical protein
MGNFYLHRRCPKCGGNMYLDKDYHGWYEQCLQCAFIHDLPVVYENKKKDGTVDKQPAATGPARKV